jgi:hypothetical protein
MHSNSSARAKALPATTAVVRSLKAKTTAAPPSGSSCRIARSGSPPCSNQKISLKPRYLMMAVMVTFVVIL